MPWDGSAIWTGRQAVGAESHARRRLADTLHDGAVQQLSIALRGIDTVPQEEAERLSGVRSAVELALGQLRGEIFDLYPFVLDVDGLEGALSQLTLREGQRAGFAVDLTVDPDADGVADLVTLSTARELLTNVAKHAQATRVAVRVVAESGLLVLTVADDGVGLAPGRREQAIRELHYGLMTTTERIEALGGRLDLAGAPGQGTTATARIPRAASPLAEVGSAA